MRRKLILTFILISLLALAGLGAWHYWTHRYDQLIIEVSARYSLEPALVKAVVYEESFFNPRARSAQNAVGLMQVTRVVAQEWVDATRSRSLTDAVATVPRSKRREVEPSFEEVLSDPHISLHVGCWYLQGLLRRYADQPDPLTLALAAYNAGPTNVERWVPISNRSTLSREEFIARIEFPATRSYVQKIILRYNDYKRDNDLN